MITGYVNIDLCHQYRISVAKTYLYICHYYVVIWTMESRHLITSLLEEMFVEAK